MKHRSPAFNYFKSKEYRGDALLKFVVADIFIKTFPDYTTTSHVPKMDMLIRNNILIDVAKKIGLPPYPDDVEECKEFKPNRPYANAVEAHLYDIYENGTMEAVYGFVRHHIFTPEMINKLQSFFDAEKKKSTF